MPQRTTLNISLTPELQRFLDDKLATGRYGSSSEIVREGLRLIHERDRALHVEEMRAQIEIGWQQSERGEGRDGGAVVADLKRKLLRQLASQRSTTSKRRKSA